MSSEQLTEEAMALPLAERIALAQTLWESLNEGPREFTVDDEDEAVGLAARRDADLTSGVVAGRSHEQVMSAARRALGCD